MSRAAAPIPGTRDAAPSPEISRMSNERSYGWRLTCIVFCCKFFFRCRFVNCMFSDSSSIEYLPMICFRQSL